MKSLIWTFAKPVLQLVGLLFGFYVAIDVWVVNKVQTKIEPVEIKLASHIQSGEVIRSGIQHSLDRLELESRMMRSNQEETNRLLLKIYRR